MKTVTECLLHARHWAMHFTCVIPIQIHYNHLMSVLLLIQENYHLLHKISSRGQQSLILSLSANSVTLNVVTKKVNVMRALQNSVGYHLNFLQELCSPKCQKIYEKEAGLIRGVYSQTEKAYTNLKAKERQNLTSAHRSQTEEQIKDLDDQDSQNSSLPISYPYPLKHICLKVTDTITLRDLSMFHCNH